MMNNLTRTLVTAGVMISAVAFTSLVMVGCKSSTEPAANQEYDSEASADITASALGTESGGAGVSFADAFGLAQTGYVPSVMDDPKSGSPMSRDSSYDSSTKLHTLTITRGSEWGKYSFDATIIYKYTFYDASGNTMQYYQKGVTDKIVIDVTRNRSQDYGDRLDVDAEASGHWVITGITTTPILNGTYSKDGSVVFHTLDNGDRGITYNFDATFTNDTIVQSSDNGRKHVYLSGPATSHLSATTTKGVTFTRDTKITFNGDGTATLEVTRTSGDGSVDTYTVDVKVGYWLRRGR